METPDYLTYKKTKNQYIEESKEKHKKSTSKIKALCIIFGLSFVLCLVIIINIAGSFNARVDIEQTHQGIDILDENSPIEQKGSIDKRLENIYNEEIGLSTARAVNKQDDEIMDPNTYKEMSSEIENEQRNKINSKDDVKKIELKEELPIPTFTRVLVGKYQTVEEATKVQEMIKEMDGFTSPFIRKMGEVYSIQVGSYTNPAVAQDIAKKLDNEGFYVWILEN